MLAPTGACDAVRAPAQLAAAVRPAACVAGCCTALRCGLLHCGPAASGAPHHDSVITGLAAVCNEVNYTSAIFNRRALANPLS